MLLKTASVYVYHFSAAIKHAYLLRYLLDSPDYEVCNYINDRGFSLFRGGPDWLQRFLNLFSGIENRVTLHKNGIPRRSITVLHSWRDIRPDDIVLLYNIQAENYRHMDQVAAFKAVSLLHFHGNKHEEALMKQAGVACFFCETNLAKTSALFRKYYHFPSTPWVIHPFVFQERFKPIKPFSERLNRAFSVGTITYKTSEEFLSVYSDPCDQPMRKAVLVEREFFADTADSYSSDYLEGSDVKEVKARDNALVRFGKKVWNRFHTGHQKKYFSFDMVEKFNDYKMCIVGEEILGVPGIGFVEGMACGCAYLGLDSPMYTDLGLQPGVHYIAYDGTKEDLRDKIRYYQAPEHQAELEQIARTGCDYVRQHFRGPAAARALVEGLVAQHNKWQNTIN